ncbi:MAG TPA: hypothetical protein ENN73_05645, partial [Firmicutes bacterium]|nr:hypothetical protein [Bacillota bacterium]
MNPFLLKNNLTLLQGKVISRPHIFFTESGVKVLKFLFKIPGSEFGNGIGNSSSFETVSVYATDHSAEIFYDLLRLNEKALILGRLINIRTRRRTFSTYAIDKIISVFLSEENKYSNAPPQKRDKLRQKMLSEFPEREYLGKFRSELLAINVFRSGNIRNIRNSIELSGKILPGTVKEEKNRYLFNCRVNRPPELSSSGIIKDQTKFDIITLSVRKELITDGLPCPEEKKKKLIKVFGRIQG